MITDEQISEWEKQLYSVQKRQEIQNAIKKFKAQKFTSIRNFYRCIKNIKYYQKLLKIDDRLRVNIEKAKKLS